MEGKRYHVILTGELLPGFALDTAVAMMADMFQAQPNVIRDVFQEGHQPVNGEFLADEALDLQTRLERIGVRSRIERVPDHKIELQLRGDRVGPGAGSGRAGLMHCPACGREQQVAARCTACGIVFRDFQRQPDARVRSPAAHGAATQDRPAAGSAAAGTAPDNTADGHAQANWRKAWGDFEEEDKEPDEITHMALFYGPNGQGFTRISGRIMDGPRNKFVLGWVWGAVFSPFLWTLYRKMWGWSVVLLVTEILLPLILITLGYADGRPTKWAYVGYFGLVANRLFWPAVLPFLYCLHARASIARLHHMSQSRATDMGIATTGGISLVSVFVGTGMAAVLSLLVWSVLDSVRQEQINELDQRMVASADRPDVNPNPDSVTGVAGAVADTENKWVVTKRRLRGLGQGVNTWLTRSGTTGDASQVTLFKLREELALQPDALLDSWGNEIQYIPDNEGYRLISSGPDLLFGTADDIQYRRVLAR